MDARNMTDAIMSGVARYQEWRRTFITEWTETQDKSKLAAMFATFPPEMKEAMRNADPENYDQLVDYLGSR